MLCSWWTALACHNRQGWYIYKNGHSSVELQKSPFHKNSPTSGLLPWWCGFLRQQEKSASANQTTKTTSSLLLPSPCAKQTKTEPSRKCQSQSKNSLCIKKLSDLGFKLAIQGCNSFAGDTTHSGSSHNFWTIYFISFYGYHNGTIVLSAID